ncbi:hypothetical protein [Pedobacter sp. SL55]|uniref:hypothetical protein n=1 Tax=Pedobacter sp. SL55 TaxID=2995161 RepID=UPI00226EA184|nr:hypothetical protein [Pedobacter sp. SL55]WAC42518.1 hypothetical protein OVA16_09250 [Pedobacter sp. SL55]
MKNIIDKKETILRASLQLIIDLSRYPSFTGLSEYDNRLWYPYVYTLLVLPSLKFNPLPKNPNYSSTYEN